MHKTSFGLICKVILLYDILAIYCYRTKNLQKLKFFWLTCIFKNFKCLNKYICLEN